MRQDGRKLGTDGDGPLHEVNRDRESGLNFRLPIAFFLILYYIHFMRKTFEQWVADTIKNKINSSGVMAIDGSDAEELAKEISAEALRRFTSHFNGEHNADW